ncbi:transmembrane protein 79-like [Takifugu flavidus]|uniref:Transmembrane protein 79 n=1 Tax=Takifugu flavidus TaxID=433684 RepID=A0A5C6NDU3_9TELE|nr:transmembrane protein 79-like [Takifugu flavidus]TWW65682.1 Transmembrane protein 79 [Takifugu flavidus]
MSGQGGLSSEDTTRPPADEAAKSEPKATKLQVINDAEARREASEEEEEAVTSAHEEPSTLPWSGDKHRTSDNHQASSEKPALPPDDEEMYRGNPDLPHPHKESSECSKARWRESMPEGDRWRDEVKEVQRDDKDDSSMADDEAEEEEEGEAESTRIPQKAPLGFMANVKIVQPSYRDEPEECRVFLKKEEEEQRRPDSAARFYSDWTEEDDKRIRCQRLCGKKVKVCLAMVASGILFPLLVWGGYALLPFDPPLVLGTPFRVVYTLRCSFFATIPIVLGMVVLGGARLRYGAVVPLFQTKEVHREVAAHWHYVNESLSLFLFYFLQLAVMATYLSHDLLKLVPLLTIVFVFGRLIYWLCLALGSASTRTLGFGFSFLPILVMLAANLYYVCSSVGQEAIFEVAPPTTAPPPRQRWWG